MFSEYLEDIKPSDDILEKWEKEWEKNQENNESNVNNSDKKEKNDNSESKEKNKQDLQAEETNAKINGRMNFLKNDDPHSANLKEKQYTLSSAFSESMEAWIGQIDEKKIPWFKKILPDGSEAKLICSDDSFFLNITKGGETWKQELNINLSNFKSKTNTENDWDNQKQKNSMPQMTVTWNIKLLDKNLQSSSNIVEIVNSIEKNIMRKERQDVHWVYQSKIEKKEQESNKIDSFRTFLCELQFDPQKDNEEMLKYLRNPENFNDNDNLDYRSIIEWLCVLCRHHTMEKIINILDLPIQEQAEKMKESTFSSWEFVIEYLMTASDSSVSLIIKNKDQIVKLSQQEW